MSAYIYLPLISLNNSQSVIKCLLKFNDIIYVGDSEYSLYMLKCNIIKEYDVIDNINIMETINDIKLYHMYGNKFYEQEDNNYRMIIKSAKLKESNTYGGVKDIQIVDKYHLLFVLCGGIITIYHSENLSYINSPPLIKKKSQLIHAFTVLYNENDDNILLCIACKRRIFIYKKQIMKNKFRTSNNWILCNELFIPESPLKVLWLSLTQLVVLFKNECIMLNISNGNTMPIVTISNKVKPLFVLDKSLIILYDGESVNILKRCHRNNSMTNNKMNISCRLKKYGILCKYNNNNNNNNNDNINNNNNNNVPLYIATNLKQHIFIASKEDISIYLYDNQLKQGFNLLPIQVIDMPSCQLYSCKNIPLVSQQSHLFFGAPIPLDLYNRELKWHESIDVNIIIKENNNEFIYNHLYELLINDNKHPLQYMIDGFCKQHMNKYNKDQHIDSIVSDVRSFNQRLYITLLYIYPKLQHWQLRYIIENVIDHIIFPKICDAIFPTFIDTCAHEEEKFLKKCALMKDLNLYAYGSNLGNIIKDILTINDLRYSYQPCFDLFYKIHQLKSPLNKLKHMLKIYELICDISQKLYKKYNQKDKQKELTMSADELLPILVFVLVNANLIDINIHAEILFALSFMEESHELGKFGYIATSLQVALHHINEYKIDEPIIIQNDDKDFTFSAVGSMLLSKVTLHDDWI